MSVKSHELESVPVSQAEELDEILMELNPQPVTYFTPDNLQEVMEDFLSGKTRNPSNATYSALDGLDFSKRRRDYEDVLERILTGSEVPPQHRRVYENFLRNYIKINSLMETAVNYRLAESDESQRQAREKFEGLNKELYGEPSLGMANLIAKEILDDTSGLSDEKFITIRSEFESLLSSMLPKVVGENIDLEPTPESKELVSRMVKTIYGPLLKHADSAIELLSKETGSDKSSLRIGPQAIAIVFQTIIDQEFPNSGWKVEIKSANAINVVASKKTIVVPEDKKPIAPNILKGLVVHEVGVHMLRAMVGASSDLAPLQYGFSGYLEAEEGIAKVMDSEFNDKKARTGYQHYLTATLIGLGYDFRDVFEVMWRYKVLDRKLERPEKDLTDSFIARQKREAFKFMFRSIRGTNELPWHITLNYFNGTRKVWDFIDTHANDPDLATFLFMGKSDPTNLEHVKAALSAKGRV